MGHRIKGHSSSPFYDMEFAAQKLPSPSPRPYRKRNKTMPIVQRTIERWTCDRCGAKEEFPDAEGRVAQEVGWLRLDLTRSLTDPPYLFGKNEQILCPTDTDKLGLWFATDSTPASATYNDGENSRYHWVTRGRTGDTDGSPAQEGVVG